MRLTRDANAPYPAPARGESAPAPLTCRSSPRRLPSQDDPSRASSAGSSRHSRNIVTLITIAPAARACTSAIGARRRSTDAFSQGRGQGAPIAAARWPPSPILCRGRRRRRPGRAEPVAGRVRRASASASSEVLRTGCCHAECTVSRRLCRFRRGALLRGGAPGRRERTARAARFHHRVVAPVALSKRPTPRDNARGAPAKRRDRRILEREQGRRVGRGLTIGLIAA